MTTDIKKILKKERKESGTLDNSLYDYKDNMTENNAIIQNPESKEQQKKNLKDNMQKTTSHERSP